MEISLWCYSENAENLLSDEAKTTQPEEFSTLFLADFSFSSSFFFGSSPSSQKMFSRNCVFVLFSAILAINLRFFSFVHHASSEFFG
jgi:hypothetical protein